jgi:aspartate kinase
MHELLTGIRMIKEISPRTSDYLVSFGERISCQIVAAHFNQRGMAAQYHFAYDIGMLTDNVFQNAQPLPEAYDLIRQHLSDTSYVPVVTGFVGKNKKGEITTLGRGGSDYTAAILGGGIGAEEIQIWTDVDGILTTDPRMVPAARNVPVVSFKEAAELAYYGAKVLHPKTIRPAMERGIPVVVKNTGRPEHPGTRIISDPPANGKLAKALSVKKNVTLINVYSLRMLDAVGFLARIFNAFAQHNVAVDMISTSEVSVSITVEGSQPIDAVVAELSTFARVDSDTNYAIVCVVGEGMRRGVGIAGQIFKVMSDEQIPVEMISQGASDINLGFVIKEKHVEKAVARLHAVLFE